MYITEFIENPEELAVVNAQVPRQLVAEVMRLSAARREHGQPYKMKELLIEALILLFKAENEAANGQGSGRK